MTKPTSSFFFGGGGNGSEGEDEGSQISYDQRWITMIFFAGFLGFIKALDVQFL